MGQLADILVQRGGYNMTDALNAEKGPRAGELAREFGLGGDSGGSSGGYQPISAPDLAKLREQAAGILKDYYVSLAKNAEGDFDLAVKNMRADYSSGVRTAKETQLFEQKYGTAALDNALKTLGVDFTKENESLVDGLNKRGMATYQNNPDGTPNVVQPGTFNPSFDANTYTTDAGVSAQNPNSANLGRGGVEANRLRTQQQLRAEATMRAGMKPLEAAGMQLKNFTNPSAGFDINNPDTFGSVTQDQLAQMGSAERAAVQKYQSQRQDLRNTRLNIGNQYQGAISDLSSQAANTADRKISTELGNQFQKELTSDFLKAGI